MVITSNVYNHPAVQGQVAGLAIEVVITMRAVQTILEEIAPVDNPIVKKALGDLQVQIEELNKRFDDLTGWKP